MDDTEYSQSQDWRKRLHELPSGTESDGPSVLAWLLRAGVCVGLFVAGSIFLILSGAFAALGRGIGPENTGGAVYFLYGFFLNVLTGAALAALMPRLLGRRRFSRLVFYSFTAPAFIGIILVLL